MEKLKLTGRNLRQVFNSRLGRAFIGHAILHITTQPNLKLKTRPKQLLGYLLLDFILPDLGNSCLIFIKNNTRLERLARDKHYSLLQKLVSYGRKKFCNIGTSSFSAVVRNDEADPRDENKHC